MTSDSKNWLRGQAKPINEFSEPNFSEKALRAILDICRLRGKSLEHAPHQIEPPAQFSAGTASGMSQGLRQKSKIRSSNLSPRQAIF